MTYDIDRRPFLHLAAAKIGTDVAEISKHVIDLPEFALWSGSDKDKHHYGQGGLQQHTYEVVNLMLSNMELLAQYGHKFDERVVFLSGLFHDIGKTRDYRPLVIGVAGSYREWDATLHKRKIHHISRSGIIWSLAVEKTGLCKDIEDDVLHCILSHHGLRQWGSPVFPKTKEAWLLHHCDSISARMSDCEKVDLVHSV